MRREPRRPLNGQLDMRPELAPKDLLAIINLAPIRASGRPVGACEWATLRVSVGAICGHSFLAS